MPDLYVAPEEAQKPELKKEEETQLEGEKKIDELANPKDIAPWQRTGKQLPFFSSYCFQPEGITFTNQEPDEHIILFLRRHMVTNLGWMTLTILLLLIPFLFTFIYNAISPYFPVPVIPFNYLLIFILFYYLIVSGYAFVHFISWFYNVGIISSKRIIDIDFKDIMYRETAFARITDIVDVEFHQGGFMHSFFDYGDIFIQTAGNKPNFEFKLIPRPDKVTDIILDLKERKHAK